jgi:hypothetical protein
MVLIPVQVHGEDLNRRREIAMYRPRRLAAALLALLPLGAAAQIGPPPSPTATRPVVAPPPTPAPLPIPAQPAPADSLSGQMAPVKSSSQTQQQLRTHPIQSKGPSQPAPMRGPAVQSKVYDRNGRIIPGVKQVGPNRVLDTRTGRYYDAVPSGDGQQIKP